MTATLAPARLRLVYSVTGAPALMAAPILLHHGFDAWMPGSSRSAAATERAADRSLARSLVVDGVEPARVAELHALVTALVPGAVQTSCAPR